MLTPITREEARRRLPHRAKESHKGTYGTLSVIGGSACYRGAALLACGGAHRVGAGIVCLCATERVIDAVISRFPECILRPLPEGEDGGIDPSSLAHPEQVLPKTTAILVGCGMGNTARTGKIVKDLLLHHSAPMLIDADGLNALSAREDKEQLLARVGKELILTPHIGEMARLCALPIDQIKQSPAQIASLYAKQWGVTLVLKDAVTHVASPKGEVWQSTTGNAGLARGGSGDVLAGIISSLLAQGKSALDAAICGVYLHGAAADLAAEQKTMTCMLPSDLFDTLPAVISSLGSAN